MSRKLELEWVLVIKSFALYVLSSRSSKVTLVQTTDIYPTFRFLGEDVANSLYVSEHQGQGASGV